MSDDRINRIETKIDKIGDRISSVDVTLAAQHESLQEHMRRTNLLENQMEPVKKHVDMVNGALKLIGLVGILAAIAEGTITVLSYFNK